MGGSDLFDEDEEEALEKLERLWTAFEEASDTAARYAGSIGWKTNGGVEYLTHTVNLRYEGNRQRTRSLGPRSPDTERRKAAFEAGREQAKVELDRIQGRLDTHAKVLKALRIGRVQAVTARFLRELRSEGFGAAHFTIGGNAALAAYEVRSRMRMPFHTGDAPDLDLMPTELFVRDRGLFDAIAARKIFGPVEEQRDSLVFGRGIVLRLLSGDVIEAWRRKMRRADALGEEIDALNWAFEGSEAIPLLAVGLDGTPTPLPALDPRAFAILSSLEGRYLVDPSRAERLPALAAACAAVASTIVAEPFERGHLALFPEIADAIDEGGGNADDRLLMRP